MGAENGGWFCATHVLLRKRVPLPQVLLQSLQGLQRDHFASEIFLQKSDVNLSMHQPTSSEYHGVAIQKVPYPFKYQTVQFF